MKRTNLLNGFSFVGHLGVGLFVIFLSLPLTSNAQQLMNESITLGHGGRSAVLGDIDGDGDDDLIIGIRSASNALYLNDGAGNFTYDPSFSTTITLTEAIAIGDLDGDGDLDFVEGNRDSQNNRVFLNDGTGSFTSGASNVFGTANTYDVDLADLDGDGDLDIFVCNVMQSNTVYMNDGSANFVKTQDLLLADSRKASLGDIDGDGDIDAVVANYTPSGSTVYKNDGTGNFTYHTGLGVDFSFDIALGDLDADDDLDVYLVNLENMSAGRTNKILLNDGTGLFSNSGFTTPSDISRSVDLTDLDLDGDLDVVVGNTNGSISAISINNGSGMLNDDPYYEFGKSGDINFDVLTSDLDGDGYVEIISVLSTDTKIYSSKPQVSLLSPSDDELNATSSLFEITFKDTVQLGSGDVYLVKTADSSLVSLLSVASLAADVDKVTLNFGTVLDNIAQSVIIPDSAFKNGRGQKFPGILTRAGWNFTTNLSGTEVISASPADNTVSLPQDIDFKLTFNRDVRLNTDLGAPSVFYLMNALDSTVVETFNFIGPSNLAEIVNDTLTFSATGLDQGKTYAIYIPDNLIEDLNDLTFAGYENLRAWNFTTTGVTTVHEKFAPGTQNAKQRFGEKMAIDGDVLVVTEFLNGTNSVNGGAAFVFERSGTDWTITAVLTPSDPQSNLFFGADVAIEDDLIVISAGKFDDGRVYLFERPAAGWTTATETAKLDASGIQKINTYYGWSVAVADGVVAVSSRTTNTNGTSEINLFEKVGTSWSRISSVSFPTGSSNGYDIDFSASGVSLLEMNLNGDMALFQKPTAGWAANPTMTTAWTETNAVTGTAIHMVAAEDYYAINYSSGSGSSVQIFSYDATGSINAQEIKDVSEPQYAGDFYFDDQKLTLTSNTFVETFYKPIAGWESGSLASVQRTNLISPTSAVKYVVANDDYLVVADIDAQGATSFGKLNIVTATLFTQWDGTSWTSGLPNLSTTTRIEEDLEIVDKLSANDVIILSGKNVTVKEGGLLEVQGTLTTNDGLVISSGGNLVTYESSSAIIGSYELQRVVAHTSNPNAYSFVGTGAPTIADNNGTDLGSFVFRYDETQSFDNNDGLNRWVDASADNQLIAGKGYTTTGVDTLKFLGIGLNNGIQEVVGLTHTTASANLLSDRGWNLIANPYPCSIDASAFLTENSNVIDGAIYLWDDAGANIGSKRSGDYLTYTQYGISSGGSGSTFDGKIAAGQGFFVRVTNPSTTTITFTESMRVNEVSSSQTFFRQNVLESSLSYISLELSGKDHVSETVIGFSPASTLGIDSQYDAIKIKGNDLQFYSYVDAYPMAVQSLPMSSNLSIGLGFDAEADQILKLSIEEVNDISEEVGIYLIDELLETKTNLRTQEYTFTQTHQVKGSTRFSIVFEGGKVLGNQPPLDDQLLIGKDETFLKLYLPQLDDQTAHVQIFTIGGKQIVSCEVAFQNGLATLQSNWKQGVYIVNVTSSQNVYRSKFKY